MQHDLPITVVTHGCRSFDRYLISSMKSLRSFFQVEASLTLPFRVALVDVDWATVPELNRLESAPLMPELVPNPKPEAPEDFFANDLPPDPLDDPWEPEWIPPPT